jgi:hypothetical protein
MKLFVIIALSLVSGPAHAANWELCLDQADFTFNVDAFLRSARVTKSDCRMELVSIGGKGARYRIDLCDPIIHIDVYPAIDADSYDRYYAGSAGCPAPTFGADFDQPDGNPEKYAEARKQAMELFQAVKKAYGPEADKVDVENAANFTPDKADAKVACGQYLLSTYLDQCTAFEARKKEEAPAAVVAPARAPEPGIHPQTIRKK